MNELTKLKKNAGLTLESELPDRSPADVIHDTMKLIHGLSQNAPSWSIDATIAEISKIEQELNALLRKIEQS